MGNLCDLSQVNDHKYYEYIPQYSDNVDYAP